MSTNMIEEKVDPMQTMALYQNLINSTEKQEDSSLEDNLLESLDPKTVPALFNFIVNTYRIAMEMEDKMAEYVKGAKNKEKDVEDLWKKEQSAKVKEIRGQAALHKQAAVTAAVILTLRMISGVAGTTLSALPNNNEQFKAFGRLLSEGSSSMCNTGDQIANNLTQNQMQLSQASIETMGQHIQSLWESDRQDAQARKSELDQLLEKLRNSTQSAIEKTGSIYSSRG